MAIIDCLCYDKGYIIYGVREGLMAKVVDLTDGSITRGLIKLAIPIIGTSFMEMAYNFTDMIWVGRLNSNAVAAVGTAGFFTWLASALIIIAKVGAEVGVAQSIGRKDYKEARNYIRHSIQLIIGLSLIYSIILITLRKPLIRFYRLGLEVEQEACTYLLIISMGMVPYTINPIFTAIFTGAGDSTTPFRINTIGLVTNIILDPVLIFGFGPIPRLETAGAAIATVIAQVIVTLLFCICAKQRPELFSDLRLRKKPDRDHLNHIIKMGAPMAAQSAFFTFIAMIIARIIAKWGPLAIAVQKVGSQIESISWMTAGGFETAMSAFIGQNYGARKLERMEKGYFVGLGLVAVIGVFATFLLAFGAQPLFAIFIPEPEAISRGADYLRILALSQLGMCVEIVTTGAFIGHGFSLPPAIVSIGFNLLRIPGALLLSSTTLGLNGVWWAISISSIFKGSVLFIWYLRFMRKHREASKSIC